MSGGTPCDTRDSDIQLAGPEGVHACRFSLLVWGPLLGLPQQTRTAQLSAPACPASPPPSGAGVGCRGWRWSRPCRVRCPTHFWGPQMGGRAACPTPCVPRREQVVHLLAFTTHPRGQPAAPRGSGSHAQEGPQMWRLHPDPLPQATLLSILSVMQTPRVPVPTPPPPGIPPVSPEPRQEPPPPTPTPLAFWPSRG